MSDQFETDDDYTEDAPAELEAEGLQEGEPDEAEPEQSESGDEGEHDSESGYVETDDPKVKSRLGQLTREKYEAKREAEEYKRRLDELERKQSESSAPKPVEAPNADMWMDEPEKAAEQQKAHQEYVRNQAIHEHQQNQLEQQKQAAKQKQLQETAATYNKRAQELKVNPAELQQAGNFVGSAGLNEEVLDYLLTHENGPSIVTELGKNPDALYQLRDMKPHLATVQIERQFGSLTQPKRKPSNTPPPPTRVGGARTTGKQGNDGTLYE
tara:strand:- start:7545 stop:8351 length:807 start_codon:yes stop_codon:yes gene_type:complete